MTGGLQMATQMASSQQASYQKQLKKLQAAQKKLQKQQVCPPTSSVRTFNHVACNLTVCPPHLKLITARAVKTAAGEAALLETLSVNPAADAAVFTFAMVSCAKPKRDSRSCTHVTTWRPRASNL